VQFTTAVGEDCTPVGSVDFVWSPFEPEVGDEMTFLASATGTAPISYAWDFGDGDTASGEQVLHFYDSGGVYPVTLTASNACGEQSISHSISIAPFMQLYLPVISNAQP
jgi:PKD repeat protein